MDREPQNLRVRITVDYRLIPPIALPEHEKHLTARRFYKFNAL